MGENFMQDEIFMKKAIELSKLAVEHGNEPFGAVLVKDDQIIFTNENQIYTRHDPTFHGEAGLIREFCAQTAITDKLKELSIPYIYMGEYLEESPLGKAEWMVVLSELTDSREKGIEIFSEIPKRYLSLKALTESVGQCPTVMFNTPWNDSWVMPSTKSYMAQLVADAGAEYIYKENSSNSSTSIGLETAYGLIQKADYWINVGSATSLDELKTVNPKFADAKAVRERTVYNNNLRLTPTGGNDYWESAVIRPDVVLRDLIHIFHPELVPDSLYYYRHLE